MTIQKVKGWMLNGQMPTGKTVKIHWSGKTIETSVVKYTFLKGLDFKGQVVVFSTSETDAWNQLRELVKEVVMAKVMDAIKMMSEQSFVRVNNSLIDEIGEILYGLGVNYTISKVDANHSKLYID